MKNVAKKLKNHRASKIRAVRHKKRIVQGKSNLETAESIESIEAQLSLKARKLLEEAREIRRRIGPVPFKTIDIIREIRGE